MHLLHYLLYAGLIAFYCQKQPSWSWFYEPKKTRLLTIELVNVNFRFIFSSKMPLGVTKLGSCKTPKNVLPVKTVQRLIYNTISEAEVHKNCYKRCNCNRTTCLYKCNYIRHAHTINCSSIPAQFFQKIMAWTAAVSVSCFQHAFMVFSVPLLDP